MPIDNDEAARLIRLIEETVSEITRDPNMRGIKELISQWKADVEAGRPIQRKLSVRADPGNIAFIDEESSRPTARGEFVGREDYTPLEQLDMLVEALGLAFLAPTMMSRCLLDAIKNFGHEQDQKGKPEPTIYFMEGATTDTSPVALSISQENDCAVP